MNNRNSLQLIIYDKRASNFPKPRYLKVGILIDASGFKAYQQTRFKTVFRK